MLDHDDFLRTIFDASANCGPCLVYADWLEEQGDCSRAEYLRLDCERISCPKGDPQRRVLERKLANLYLAAGSTWVRPMVTIPVTQVTQNLSAVFRIAPIYDLCVDLTDLKVAKAISDLVPESVVRENRILPLTLFMNPFALFYPLPLPGRRRSNGSSLYFTPSNQRVMVCAIDESPLKLDIIPKLQFILDCSILWVRADRDQIHHQIDISYSSEVECVDSSFSIFECVSIQEGSAGNTD